MGRCSRLVDFQKACLVCGQPGTVDSHLFPRTFARQMKGDSAKHLIAITKSSSEGRYVQAGVVSKRILCESHDNMLSASDAYAKAICELIRRADHDPQPRHVVVPNRSPELLLQFIHSTLWRWVSEGRLATNDAQLPDHHYDRLQQCAFHGRHSFFHCHVLAPERPSPSRETDWAISPRPVRLEGLINIGGLRFTLKTDDRPYSGVLGQTGAHSDPLVALKLGAHDAETEHIRDVSEAWRVNSSRPR